MTVVKLMLVGVFLAGLHQGFAVVPTTVILLAGVKRRDPFSLVILVRFRGPGDSRTFFVGQDD